MKRPGDVGHATGPLCGPGTPSRADLGLLAGQSLAVWLALIWCAHIGMDRLLGFGLKYPDAFKHTHLTPEGEGGDGGAGAIA